MWGMNLDRFKGRERIEDIYRAHRKSDMKKFLLRRLDNSFKEIENIYLKFNREVSKGEALPRGTDWILDNFYLIQLIYRGLRDDIKREKRVVLNVIDDGVFKGKPRIYILASELVTNATGNITEDNIIEFINNFQIEEVLSLEEIARLSDFLILSSIEYIERIATNLMDIYTTWAWIDGMDISDEEDIENMLEDILYAPIGIFQSLVHMFND